MIGLIVYKEMRVMFLKPTSNEVDELKTKLL